MDLLFNWIFSSRSVTAVKIFLYEASKVGLVLMVLHFVGVIAVSLTPDTDFLKIYVEFIKSWNSVPAYEFFTGLMILSAMGAIFLMGLCVLGVITYFIIVAIFAIPYYVYKWGKRKWDEIYNTEDDNEDNNVDDEDDTYECSTCEEVR